MTFYSGCVQSQLPFAGVSLDTSLSCGLFDGGIRAGGGGGGMYPWQSVAVIP